MSTPSEYWIDEFHKIVRVTGDQGSVVVDVSSPTLTATVTATNGAVTIGNVTESVWLVNPEAYAILEEITGPPAPPATYDGPPRNRHERRAAARGRNDVDQALRHGRHRADAARA